MKQRQALVALLAISLLAACVDTAPGILPRPLTFQEGSIPVGSLGFPLGSDVTIEGVFPYGKGGDVRPPPEAVFPMGEKVAGSIMCVDTVNGRKLTEPAYVTLIEGNGITLPANRFSGRFSVRGYETFEMTGTAPAVEDAVKEAGQPYTQAQRGWEVTFEFAPLSQFTPVSAGSASPASGPPLSPASWGMPTGTLGYPLGDYLTIEGVKEPDNMSYSHPLKVDTINGRKLNQPITISVAGKAGDLRDGARYAVKGFETAGMNAQAPAAEAAAKEAGQYSPAQQLWGICYWFEGLSITAK